MLDMFRKNRQYKALADKVGQEILRQLRQVLKEKPTAVNSPWEITFITGYIKSFTTAAFHGIGCKENAVHLKYIRHICNGVLPGRLWDLFQRGEALNELSQNEDRVEYKKTRESYDLGSLAGRSDSDEFFSLEKLPMKFYSFLKSH